MPKIAETGVACSTHHSVLEDSSKARFEPRSPMLYEPTETRVVIRLFVSTCRQVNYKDPMTRPATADITPLELGWSEIAGVYRISLAWDVEHSTEIVYNTECIQPVGR